MVGTLSFRTADNTRWGGGNVTDLTAVQVDINFWTLFEAIAQLEADQDITVSIDFITVSGNQMFITLTNHAVLGPFTLPTAQWKPRGVWTPNTAYAPFDVVSNAGNLYLVTTAHTSAATFNSNATDGLGQALYILILSAPANSLPNAGNTGQVLMKASESPFVSAWSDLFIRMVAFVGGQPNPSELLLQYVVVDDMTIPAGLVGSAFFANTPTATDVTYTITHNTNPIGSITFNGPSPENITVSFTADITCVPDDVIALVGPVTPDARQADITFVIVATLT